MRSGEARAAGAQAFEARARLPLEERSRRAAAGGAQGRGSSEVVRLRVLEPGVFSMFCQYCVFLVLSLPQKERAVFPKNIPPENTLVFATPLSRMAALKLRLN